jgi:hypothetical protein
MVIEEHRFRIFAEGAPLKTIPRRPRPPGIKQVIRPRSNRRANPNQLR